MKLMNILAASALTLIISTTAFAQEKYGKSFNTDKAFPATELASKMGDKKSMNDVVLSGEISQVCQMAGCWVKLKNDAGEDIFVKFQDGEIAVPKDMAGRKAFVHGRAVKKTVSVDDLKHFAQDEGKSEEEIAAIKEPKTQYRVESNGIVILN